MGNVTYDKQKPRKTTPEEARSIIERREPYGLFWTEEQTADGASRIIGIDNRTGCAWTEEFASLAKCLGWLRGKEL